jgi:hypothetical protein
MGTRVGLIFFFSELVPLNFFSDPELDRAQVKRQPVTGHGKARVHHPAHGVLSQPPRLVLAATGLAGKADLLGRVPPCMKIPSCPAGSAGGSRLPGHARASIRNVRPISPAHRPLHWRRTGTPLLYSPSPGTPAECSSNFFGHPPHQLGHSSRNLPFETLDVAVLHGPARLDQDVFGAVIVRPSHECPAGKFGGHCRCARPAGSRGRWRRDRAAG